MSQAKSLHYQFHIIVLHTVILTLAAIFYSSTVHAADWPERAKGEVRYLKFIKVYDISLHSPTIISAKTILEPNISKCLKLNYAVDLSVDKLRLATAKILQRQHSADYLNNIKQPLEQLQQAFRPIKKGDEYQLCYNGRTQMLRLDLNKKPLIEMRSAELAKAYMGIWLSHNKPISGPLYRRFFSTTNTTSL